VIRRPFHKSVIVVAVLLFATFAGSGFAGSAPGQQPPSSVSAPTISGTAMAGQTLSASPGSWKGVSLSYAYQWRRCDLSGGGCNPLGGATATTYKLGSADVGTTLRVDVTASNKNGSATATATQTAVVAPVPAPTAPPANTALPQISGTAQVGQTLTSSAGTWSGSPTGYGYQWKRCDAAGANCAAISGATASSYALTTTDAAATIRVAVTATNSGGSTSATSAATAAVAATPTTTSAPANTALPQLSGTAQAGQTMKTSTGTWSGSPSSYAYQWKRCDSAGANCAAITGATASSYAVASGDVGSTLRAAVSATNSGGTGTAISPQSAAATPASGGTLSPFGVAAGGNIQWFSAADQARELDGMVTMGAKWLRFDVPWSVVEQTPGVYNWVAEDNVVAAARARGLNVLLMIGYTPTWARSAACPSTDKCEPANVADYGRFAEATVRHYAPLGVHAYELWNEPNLGDVFWKPKANPTKYAALVRASYPLMKAADPSSTILAGAFAPAPDSGNDMSSTQFLKAAYAAGLHGYFDALSDHPYYGPIDVTTFKDWSAWMQMSMPTSYGPALHDQMVAAGDGDKKIWATEANMRVQNQCVDGFCSTLQRQADLLTEAYTTWRSYPWAGVMFVYTYWNDPNGWSLVNPDWSPTPAWNAYKALPKT